MTAAGFYRRPLPGSLVPFSSAAGRALFREALAEGTMEGWFPLAEQFHTQAEPAFCGLGSLVMVLNALAIDPGRAWKGPWRWYGEELLDCCAPLEHVRARGITMPRLACLARCNGVDVDVRYADEGSIEDLRGAVAGSARAEAGPYVIASFSRAALEQSGGGHYSPIGGYHAASDRALVLDVARFKYPPFWVPLPLLRGSMSSPDPDTGRARGYLVVRRAAEGGDALCRLTAHPDMWPALRAALAEALPGLEGGACDVEQALGALLDRVGPGSLPLVDASPLDPEGWPAVVEAVRGSRIGAAARCALEGAADLPAARALRELAGGPERLALFMAAVGPRLAARPPEGAAGGLAELWTDAALPEPARAAVERLRLQVSALEEIAGIA